MSKKTILLITVIAVMSLLLAACGGGGASTTKAGEDLFAQSVIGINAGCITCHSLEAGVVTVGPSMAAIGTSAESAVAGQSADAYLRESISDPNAHLVEGFEADIMPTNWDDVLTAEQVNDLVAYLLSLK